MACAVRVSVPVAGTEGFFGKHRCVVVDDRAVRKLRSLQHDDGVGGPVRGTVSAVVDTRHAASDNDC